MAERATPRTFPSKRENSVTSRSASRNGYVRKTIASDSFSAMEAQQVIFDCNGAVLRWKGGDPNRRRDITAIDRQPAIISKPHRCKRKTAPGGIVRTVQYRYGKGRPLK
jgi:hypothetical protein